ncbi:hypothetical protein KPH14_012823 [Odynerus spinipes]|uniref:Uncharacterized protein n=1 Tax=Odynerus spinipes TaxID=1348599 RepID=A0AAD9VHW7_9HYME|nr:hypothetical protein KPH14_012823 [Odynerus spinipes]
MQICKFKCYRTLIVSTYGEEPSYGIRKFEDLPTFYLEPLGQLRLYTEQWKLISYLPLNGLMEQGTHIENGIKEVKELDNVGRHSRTIYQLEKSLQQAKKCRERLFSSVGYGSPEPRRTRRGVFDFVGDVSKILFGTMSSADAEYYNKEIDLVHNDNKHNAELFKNQTQILKVVLENNNKLVTDYKEKISTISLDMRKLEKMGDTTLLDETILEFCMMLELEIFSFQRNIDITSQAIVDGRQGIISPNVVDPKVFYKLIQKIRAEEGTNRLPQVAVADHYYEYLQICTIEIVIIKQKLVSVIKIPILEKPKYRITSEKNCLGRWLREVFDNNTKVCTPFVGMMQYSLYLPLQTGSDWIIIPHKQEQIQILCGQTSTFKTLTGPSIIHLEPDCIASTDFAILEPVHTSNRIITELRFDLPSYNFSLLHDTYRQLSQSVKLEELNNSKNKQARFTSIRQTIERLS